jgi:hypothetical protein
MGATRAKWRANQLAYYDGSTFETVLPVAPVYLFDDFLGTAVNGDIWTDLDLNNATTDLPASSLFAARIGAVNENAAAGLYGKDDKPWNIDKGFIFECRLSVHTAPAGTAEIHIGVMNDSYGADSQRVCEADEVAKYAFFTFDASLVCKIYTDDATVRNADVATGITVVAGVQHIYKIDFTDSSSVKFFIDGEQVAGSTTFKMNTVAGLLVQPWVMIYKHADATTNAAGEIRIDYIKLFQATR